MMKGKLLTGYIVSDKLKWSGLVTGSSDYWKGGKKQTWPILMYLTLHLPGRRGTDINPGCPRYEGVLTIQLKCLVVTN
jgi:hypothetical protein